MNERPVSSGAKRGVNVHLWVSLNSELRLVAYGFAKLVCRFVQCFSLENRVAASRATTP